MPTETFHNLPQEKKQIILDAAKKEFSTVAFHDASINKIIKEAGISRGSFYMYFKDKEDLYLAITLHEGMKTFEKMMAVLKKNHGDLFLTYKELFQVFYHLFSEKTTPSLSRNVLLNMSFKSDHLLVRENKEKHKEYVDQFLKMIDTSNLRIGTKEELFDIIDILNLLLIHALVVSVRKNDQDGKIRKRYERQLCIIEQGLKEGR